MNVEGYNFALYQEFEAYWGAMRLLLWAQGARLPDEIETFDLLLLWSFNLGAKNGGAKALQIQG